ncbi:hypothetical protein X980_667 [Burkholderia pseudomallei MSHR4000]|nr:hypothetical protein X980_667 [Burkholderia pseudomallei MSHR4000]
MRRSRESVVLRRPVKVECVPSGAPLELPAGTVAEITQALGTNFTLVAGGQMVRLRGEDADAIGKPPPGPLDVPDGPVTPDGARACVMQTLKTCYDPEIPVDIVELGLIYGCEIEPAGHDRLKVSITMTLTAPGCGMGEALADEVGRQGARAAVRRRSQRRHGVRSAVGPVAHVGGGDADARPLTRPGMRCPSRS